MVCWSVPPRTPGTHCAQNDEGEVPRRPCFELPQKKGLQAGRRGLISRISTVGISWNRRDAFGRQMRLICTHFFNLANTAGNMDTDTSIANYITFYSSMEQSPSRYEESYSRLRDWIYTSLDRYKVRNIPPQKNLERFTFFSCFNRTNFLQFFTLFSCIVILIWLKKDLPKKVFQIFICFSALTLTFEAIEFMEKHAKEHEERNSGE